MIARVVLICLLKIDRSDYIHKGVSFAHKRKKTRKLNNAVLGTFDAVNSVKGSFFDKNARNLRNNCKKFLKNRGKCKIIL